MRKKLNLENPETFNEKLQWLKLYDRKPEYSKMVDKYEVKEYVANIIGEEYIIPTIGVYDNFEDINFDLLPNQFVIKCTHDSGSTIVCKNKEDFNINIAKEKIDKSLKNNFYYSSREWPYKNVKPKIIVEKFMKNNDNTEIFDYKFYCFNGKVEYVMLCTERKTGNPKFYYFNKEWQLQRNMSYDGKKIEDSKQIINKPKEIEKMFEIAKELSKGIKFTRIDLYNINNKIYFGEITFYPSGGFDNERTSEADDYLNNMLKL